MKTTTIEVPLVTKLDVCMWTDVSGMTGAGVIATVEVVSEAEGTTTVLEGTMTLAGGELGTGRAVLDRAVILETTT